MSSVVPDHEPEPGDRDAVDSPCPNWKFARYLSAYRGNLTRSEAARRSGLPEVLWEQVETAGPSDPCFDLLPAAIVACMCVSVGADVATGLTLSGHRADLYPQLIETPPVFTPPTRGTHTRTGPYIATPHVVAAAIAGDSADAHLRMAAVYRQLARSNWHLANQIMQDHPDTQAEYWTGFAAAIRAVAEQQAWAADQEEAR